MIKKIGAGFTILTLLALGACKPETERTRPPRRVFAIRVADSSGLTERAFPGRARAGQEVNLSFRVAGPLIAFPADVGMQVNSVIISVRTRFHASAYNLTLTLKPSRAKRDGVVAHVQRTACAPRNVQHPADP